MVGKMKGFFGTFAIHSSTRALRGETALLIRAHRGLSPPLAFQIKL